MEKSWIQYKCKSGQTLLVFNKMTGEFKRPTDCVQEKRSTNVMLGELVIQKLCTTGTQTDDTGCINGCTSMYISKSHTCSLNTKETTTQATPDIEDEVGANVNIDSDIDDGLDNGVIDEDEITNRGISDVVEPDEVGGINLDIEPESDNGLDGGGIAEENINMDEMLHTYWGIDGNSSDKDNVEAVDPSFQDQAQDHGVKQFKCACCEQKFNRSSLLVDHVLAIHAKGQIFDHDYCKNKNIEASDVPMQSGDKTTEFHGERDSSLARGDNETVQENESLQEQIKRHGIKQFKCDHCGEAFICNYLLESHVARLHTKKSFECSYCKKKYSTQECLNEHIQSAQHNVAPRVFEKPFECPQCKKKLKYQKSLKDHIKRHNTKESPFQCSYCKKRFNCKERLEDHIRIHTEERPFECSHCKKKLKCKNALINHIRTHTGEKPFECSYCKMRFARDHVLKDHLRRHTGEKPFECYICKKKYRHKMTLKDHLQIHIGERSFECSYCKKKFVLKKGLEAHIKRHIKKGVSKEGVSQKA